MCPGRGHARREGVWGVPGADFVATLTGHGGGHDKAPHRALDFTLPAGSYLLPRAWGVAVPRGWSLRIPLGRVRGGGALLPVLSSSPLPMARPQAFSPHHLPPSPLIHSLVPQNRDGSCLPDPPPSMRPPPPLCPFLPPRRPSPPHQAPKATRGDPRQVLRPILGHPHTCPPSPLPSPLTPPSPTLAFPSPSTPSPPPPPPSLPYPLWPTLCT